MINETMVRKVAKIARLDLSEEEIKKLAGELGEIEKAFAKIREVDTAQVKPSFHPVKLENVLREDSPTRSLPREIALANTEHKEDGFFKGPRIV